jgi:flagellar L-ring protein precursor FlgH
VSIRFFGAALALLWAWNAQSDSLVQKAADRPGTLISKTNLFKVGDIITVKVNETINSTVTANTNTKKESTVEAEAPPAQNPFLVDPEGPSLISEEELPNWSIDSKNETKTRGQTVRQATLKTSVGCVITRILENDLLYIEGEKTVATNREDSNLLVAGLVRARDVGTDNTIDSSRIANATIKLSGKGPLWNNQRRGLVTRVLDWFSPF